ncbi:MAG: hypothetical protein V9H69_20990 [Anaerolineae bacterium]
MNAVELLMAASAEQVIAQAADRIRHRHARRRLHPQHRLLRRPACCSRGSWSC